MILFSHEFKWFDTVFSYYKESTDRRSVRDFQKFVGSGPIRSEIFENFLVLAQFGPRFSGTFCSWSSLVPNFSFFSVLVRDRSVLVRGSLVTIEDSTESSENFIRIFVFTYVQNRINGSINS